MSRARRPLIAGNWKMNGLTADGLALAADLAKRKRAAAGSAFDMVVCPPFTLIAGVAEVIAGSGLMLGAQDCHAAEKGAHTGDIGARMLADLGCDYVIVGHSERRTDHGETDAMVKAKAEAALAAKLAAIVCIGETEVERNGGKTLEVVRSQLLGSLPAGARADNAVIAYEPVWAIGTGRTPSENDAQEVHALIRAELAKALGQAEAGRVRVLYGGSMKPGNARALLQLADVDGGLIGGASLKADDFWGIAESCP